jgi:hypothetical protein
MQGLIAPNCSTESIRLPAPGAAVANDSSNRRPATNGEGALSLKLLIFFHHGQPRYRETIEGVLVANLLEEGVDLEVGDHESGEERASRQRPLGCVENKMSGQHDKNLRNVASRLAASD